MDIPIGSYLRYDIPENTGCGIATSEHTIGIDNDTDVFFNPERYKAGAIWFNQGFLTYRLSNKMLPNKLSRIAISFEACSEAPFYRNDWKSDITMYLGQREVGTYTSLGDYGGRRGKLNPKWWPDAITQFGVLLNWEIREDGTYVNQNRISDTAIMDIPIKETSHIDLTLGVKADAKYCGGFNIFGRSFGDYDQDINVVFYW